MKALGVSCSGQRAYFAVVEGDRIVDYPRLERFEMPSALSDGEEIVRAFDELDREVSAISPSDVAILQPGGTAPSFKSPSYAQVAPRARLEALIALASARSGARVRFVASPTVRATLGMPKRGGFDEVLAEHFHGESYGRYWREGRMQAAAAGLTCRRR